MRTDRIYITHIEYLTTPFTLIRYPLALLIKLCGRLNNRNSAVDISGNKYYLTPSHSGLCFFHDNEFHVFDFLGNGVNISTLKEKQQHYQKIALMVFEELDISFSADQLNQAKEKIEAVHEKYNAGKAAFSFLDGIINRKRLKSEGTFCSAFVTSVLASMGVSIENEHGEVMEQEPIDLVYSPKIFNGEAVKSVFFF